jgi:tRNA dimethylallyltransferase
MPTLPTRPLIAVVGATATGKSDVALALAEALDGEVISTDAYQLYRGLDIGTAKLDAASRARVPHHLVDVADADDPWSLARYLDAAQAALGDVWARGKLPVLAGGSGQYVWALLEGWQPPRVAPDMALRAELEAVAQREGVPAVLNRLAAVDPEAAASVDPANLRRIVRALEVVTRTGRPLAACQARHPIDAGVLAIGLHLDRDALYARLDARTDRMYEAGFLDEVRALRDAGLGDTSALRGGVGYKEASLYMDGALDLDEAVRRHKNANHRLVRRQAAWFKPEDARISWIEADQTASQAALTIAEAWLAARS